MKVDGFNSFQTGDTARLNSFTGNLVSSAVTYGMTGNVTFNLAKLNGSIAGNEWSTGLLEMNLGNDGFSMGIGSGGTDISVGTIAGAARGAYNWNKNINIENIAKKNGVTEAATSLRTQWGYGDAAALAQLDSILKGGTELRARSGNDSEAQTVLANGKRVVYLDNYKENMSREAKLAMGIELQHEAYRDGIVDEKNGTETLFAAAGHTAMALRMANDPRYGQTMASLIGGNVNLQNDIGAYMTAVMNGDGGIFADYVDATYDSSGDYWKLKTVLDAEGNVSSYTVDWDDSLDLTIENADGTITKIGADQIQTETGLGSISEWFAKNGLGFDDDISNGFVALGKASKAAQALTDAINNANSAGKFDEITGEFTGSIEKLIASGLRIGELGTLEDQTKMYSLMPDSTTITTLYGARLVTPELDGVITGELYNWGKFIHNAEDIAGGMIVQTPTMTSSLNMDWNDMKGFKVAIGFDNGYKLESNHLSSESSMNLLKAMLLSGSTETIAAGVQFATVGITGTATTGSHNHLAGFDPNGKPVAPSSIFNTMGIPDNYKRTNTELTGFPEGTSYNAPGVLKDILKYGPAFDRQAYVDAHSELFKPYKRGTPCGTVTYIFDISTMSYIMDRTSLVRRK